jgi:cobalt-zinc-cadmium efflux system protein
VSLSAEGTAASKKTETRLWLGLGLAALITLVEFSGGLVSHSLALVSDSGHVLTDVFTFALSIGALRLARMPHSPKWTYGYHRAEIFSALVNGAILTGVAFLIMYEAYLRFFQSPTIQANLVIVVASIALLANLTMMRLFGQMWKTSLNVKGVFLHAASDVISSTGVILSGIIVLVSGYTRADLIIAVLIGILILRNAYGLVKDSADILMEAIPKHLSLDLITKAILAVPGVRGVHDLHVWTITSGLYAVSGHLLVDPQSVEQGSRIITEVSERLRGSFGIEHVTLQLESQKLERLENQNGQV